MGVASTILHFSGNLSIFNVFFPGKIIFSFQFSAAGNFILVIMSKVGYLAKKWNQN